MVLTHLRDDPTQDGSAVGPVDGSGELKSYFHLNEGPESAPNRVCRFFWGGGATLDLTIKKKHEERGLGETFFLYIQPLLLGAGENGEENQEGRRRSQVLSAGSR